MSSLACALSVYNPDGMDRPCVHLGVITANIYDHLGVPHVVTFRAWGSDEWESLPIGDRPEQYYESSGGVKMALEFTRIITAGPYR